MILNILFKFAFEHIEQICVSDLSGKTVPSNYSLKSDRKFAIICSSKFYVYLWCWSRIIRMYSFISLKKIIEESW